MTVIRPAPKAQSASVWGRGEERDPVRPGVTIEVAGVGRSTVAWVIADLERDCQTVILSPYSLQDLVAEGQQFDLRQAGWMLVSPEYMV